MSFKEFMKALNGNEVEGELIKTVVYSLVTGFIVIVGLYFFVFKNIGAFFEKYGFALFFSALSYAFISPVIRHVRGYRCFGCMAGMMIGMTIGMVSGFLIGFYIGSTNGMFVGSLAGMIVGICLGILLGGCCGIMGSMEGIMAGFMGGLMGAMTSVMLINDHLKLSSIIVFVISTVILFGLHYMIYKETRELKRENNEGYFFIITLNLIVNLLTSLLIVYGPRSILFS